MCTSTTSRSRFNPRPRTGGDLLLSLVVFLLVCFNPRPRTGGDLQDAERRTEALTVSIRAPARGATRYTQACLACGRCFNPRPRTGGDGNISAASNGDIEFQSAPPHGGRQARGPSPTPERLFQSAPPHGGRPLLDYPIRQAARVSIRAPARGATIDLHDLADRSYLFQSAPPHGGRPFVDSR